MAKKETGPPRFTSILLKNWKNFTSCEVELAERVFLVGPNAAGKSNFLDAFRFLRDLASPGGGFQVAVAVRGGVSVIRSLAARRYPAVELRVAVKDPGGPKWEYSLAFEQDPQRRAHITHECVKRNGVELFSRPNELDDADPELLTQTHLEQVNVNREFRELASFFESVRYRHIVPQLVREPDRSVGRSNDPFGGDFLEQIASTPGNIQTSRLKRIREGLSVAVPQLAEIDLRRDSRGTPHLFGKYEHWRPQGAWQTEEQFSDGTLRLMGLLWVVMDGTGPLLLEEPELSLHPEIVRYLPQMLSRVQRRTGRQLLLSTHSSDLLADEGVGLDEGLLLRPTAGGTKVEPASSLVDVKDLLQGGVPLSDIVMPKTRPKNADQLTLFGDG